jgi:hypothetical protein
MSQLGPVESGRRQTGDQAGSQRRIRCPSSLLEPCRSIHRIHPWSMQELEALGAASRGVGYTGRPTPQTTGLCSIRMGFFQPLSSTALFCLRQERYLLRQIRGFSSQSTVEIVLGNDGNPIAIASISNGNISDLKLDTVTPTTVYVAVENLGLFKSTDSGTTFPATGTLINSASFPASINDVWITFAQSTRPDNKTIYALLCPGIKIANACAVKKSITQGASFTNISPIGSVVSVNQQKYDQIYWSGPARRKQSIHRCSPNFLLRRWWEKWLWS